jgi:hypothetical protein
MIFLLPLVSLPQQLTLAHLLALQLQTIRRLPLIAAGGTVDAITADYTPDVTLADKTRVAFRSAGVNTSTTPSFAPDGLTARTIVKSGGLALVAGDIGAAGFIAELVYDLGNTRWELLNPVQPPSTLAGLITLANGSTSAGRIVFQEKGAGTDKLTLEGAETLAGDITVKLPATAGTVARTEDLTAGTANWYTTGTIAGKFPVVAGGAADLNLSVEQVSGRIISNTGQGVNNRNHTLPVAEAGLAFLASVGEAQGASYYRFTANTTPTPDDFMCLDGTCGKTYVSIAAPTQGAKVFCNTEQIASTTAAVAIGVTTKTLASSGAFTFDIAGTGYAKAATADGTAMAAATTVQNRYGAEFLEVGVDGTIHAVAGTTVAAGFATEAEAISEIVAQAPTAAHTKIGYVTVIRTNAAGFVWGTTVLNDAETTAAFYSTAAYTKPYNWICNKVIGTWVTN